MAEGSASETGSPASAAEGWRTLSECIAARYLDEEPAEAGAAPSPVVYFSLQTPKEGEGADRYAGLQLVRTLVLSGARVRAPGDPAVLRACSKLVELDLADNGLESWTDVAAMIRHFPRLQSLTLSRNEALQSLPAEDLPAHSFPSIRTLVLNGIGLSWATLAHLSAWFPGLRELGMAQNGYGLAREREIIGEMGNDERTIDTSGLRSRVFFVASSPRVAG